MFRRDLGKWHFWLFVIGFHLTFDFMHIPGILGMPRRIYTYEPGRGWEIWNLIVSIGAIFQTVAILVFRRQPDLVVLQGRGRRQRSLGRLDAGVAHHFAASGLQLCNDSGGAQPPAVVGLETSGRSGLEVRMKDEP